MYKKLLVFSSAFCLGFVFSLKQDTIDSSDNQIVSENKIEFAKQFSSLFDTPKATSLKKEKQTSDRFIGAGVETDEEVIEFFLNFQKAVADDNKKTLASMMSYPLNVYFPTDCLRKNYRFIKTEKDFLKVYDKIFDRKLKELIASIDVKSDEDLWARYDGISVGRGDIWIGVFCYKRRCEDNKYFIKIRTIHGNNFRC